jgi:hypothetical protein
MWVKCTSYTVHERLAARWLQPELHQPHRAPCTLWPAGTCALASGAPDTAAACARAQLGLTTLCKPVQGNFLAMPFADESFNAAYAIEATCHANKARRAGGPATAATVAPHAKPPRSLVAAWHRRRRCPCMGSRHGRRGFHFVRRVH